MSARTRDSICAILGIAPEHAERIYSGEKRAELRKSFATDIRIVFLYETAPVSGVTGAFFVRAATRMSVEAAIDSVSKQGVAPDRARAYYGDRVNGWVLEVGATVKFPKAVSLQDLKETNHYFSPPQAFAYLGRYEALTQLLVSRLLVAIESSVALRPISHESRIKLVDFIRWEVGANYEDIDDDFVEQIFEGEEDIALGAFSTVRKHVLEAVWLNQLLGFTVLTEKAHGAWKSGPTIILPEFRGMGMGQVVRRSIESYCRQRNATGIYCTCPDGQASIVSYLLLSGMDLQARLKGHLSRQRDELVFAKRFTTSESHLQMTRKRVLRRPVENRRVLAADRQLKPAMNHFVRNMAHWYFKPRSGFEAAIIASISSFESGVEAYSAKGRMLFGSFDKDGTVLATALATVKRSEMAKLNVVVSVEDRRVLTDFVKRILSECGHLRRLYLTLPAREWLTIEILMRQGFAFEGILRDPFSCGVDHVCLGRVFAGRPHDRTRT